MILSGARVLLLLCPIVRRLDAGRHSTKKMILVRRRHRQDRPATLSGCQSCQAHLMAIYFQPYRRLSSGIYIFHPFNLKRLRSLFVSIDTAATMLLLNLVF